MIIASLSFTSMYFSFHDSLCEGSFQIKKMCETWSILSWKQSVNLDPGIPKGSIRSEQFVEGPATLMAYGAFEGMSSAPWHRCKLGVGQINVITALGDSNWEL